MKKCTLALGGFSAFFVFVGSLLAWSTVDVFGETFGIRGTASGFFGDVDAAPERSLCPNHHRGEVRTSPRASAYRAS